MSNRKSFIITISTKSGLIIKSNRITSLTHTELEGTLELFLGGEVDTTFCTLGRLGLIVTIKAHGVDVVTVCIFEDCARYMGVPLWYE